MGQDKPVKVGHVWRGGGGGGVREHVCWCVLCALACSASNRYLATKARSLSLPFLCEDEREAYV